MKTSDVVVRALENEGVKYIFGIPGEENLDFLNSLKDSSIRLVLTRHEQAAGFMAATCGRLTEMPGVCFSTLGPGATNLVTAAAYAKLGSMPMVMITGQKPIMKSKQGEFQILDVVDMMKSLTKYTTQIVHSHTITAKIRRAFKIAREERPGAVHLELPEDISRADSDAELFSPVNYRRPVADTHSIIEAVDRIQRAMSPLILIGAGANRRKTHDAIEFLVDKTGIPFFTTQMGKGVLDERNNLFLGTAAISRNDFLHRAIEASDLIINIGHDIVEKPPFFMTRGGFEVIHINFFSALVDEVYFPHIEIVGDISKSVSELSQHLETQDHWDFRYMLKIKEALDAHIAASESDSRFPVLPQRLVKVVRDVMPSDGIITLDNGIYKIWFARNYKAHKPNTILLDNALATMGAGLPSAIATKLIYPNREVMAICGDGGFMMNSQELETAMRMKLDLVVLILRDDALGMIRWKQTAMGFDDYGLTYRNPDFVKYAESYGAKGYRVEKTEEIDTLLRECINLPGVHVIEIPVDYSLNHEILNVELPSLTKEL